MRAKPPSPAYPIPAAYPTPQQPPTPSIFRRVFAALFSPVRRFLSWLVQPSTTWWRPLVHRRWLHHNMDYRVHHFLLRGSGLTVSPQSVDIQDPPIHSCRSFRPSQISASKVTARRRRRAVSVRDILPPLQAEHPISQDHASPARFFYRRCQVGPIFPKVQSR